MENNTINNNECRICFEGETLNNKLIHPCLCNGTSKYIHISCLNEWRYSDINRSSFYKCSECNYFYKYKLLFPSEQHNKINANFIILLSITMTPALVLSIIIGSTDQFNGYLILDTLYYNTTNYTHFKNHMKNKDVSIYWLIVFNYILYIQHILFIFFFNLYVFYIIDNINYSRYINYNKCKFILQIFLAFKFIIFYNIFCSWNQYSNLICILIVFTLFETLNYYIHIKNHNNTITQLEINNIQYILNYDENSQETDNVVHFENIQNILDITE